LLTGPADVLVDEFSKALKLFGGASIIGIVVLATAALLREGLHTRDWRTAYGHYRSDVGRGILLGLEFLVGADIIATITASLTFQSVGLLAMVVVIRTFLSVSLEMEIQGRWPWQRATSAPTVG
jgi:uncharacterized membrane protein